MARRLGVALLFAAFATAARAEEERGHCTALGVGRKATSTGSTLLAHTDDRRARGRRGCARDPCRRAGKHVCRSARLLPRASVRGAVAAAWLRV